MEFTVSVGETRETTSHIQTHLSSFPVEGGRAPSLCIAVIGATGKLARRKIFPALFALYYSGFLPEVGLQSLCMVRPLCLLSELLWPESSFLIQPVFVFHFQYYIYLLSLVSNTSDKLLTFLALLLPMAAECGNSWLFKKEFDR